MIKNVVFGVFLCISALLAEDPQWEHLTVESRRLPDPNVGEGVSCMVLDIDKDGLNDVVVGGWQNDKVVWMRNTGNARFERYKLDDGSARIEAGGAFHDIDGDGDLDVVEGGQGVPDVYWWENPYPDYAPGTAWKRYTIKNSGSRVSHHDQVFVDYDGDGVKEFAFFDDWHNLNVCEVPDNPKSLSSWDYKRIWSYGPKAEGFAVADLDGDGNDDIIGAGHWFRYRQGSDREFDVYPIDPGYSFSRSASAQVIPGGVPEVVISSGDGQGPLNLYVCSGDPTQQSSWQKKTILNQVNFGHTCQIGDIDLDGHLDVHTAEVSFDGNNTNSKTYVFYGDGTGNFTTQIIAEGVSTHEGKIGDLDGDGDLDIVGKPWKRQGGPSNAFNIWLNNGTQSEPVFVRHHDSQFSTKPNAFETQATMEGSAIFDMRGRAFPFFGALNGIPAHGVYSTSSSDASSSVKKNRIRILR